MEDQMTNREFEELCVRLAKECNRRHGALVGRACSDSIDGRHLARGAGLLAELAVDLLDAAGLTAEGVLR